MKISLTSFANPGFLDKERVVFKVEEDLEIGDFLALCTRFSPPNSGSAGANWAYWFPDMKVKKDDLVVLYTKKGSDKKKDIGGDRTAYFFYWGFDSAIWGGQQNALALVQAGEYTVEPPVDPDAPEDN